VRAVGESAIAGAGDEDEIRKKWIELGAGAVGLIPFGSVVTRAGGSKLAETVVSFAIKQASGQIKSEVTESWANLKDKEVDTQTLLAEESRQSAEYALLIAMHETGLMPQLPATTWSPGGQMLPWEQYSALPAGIQLEARSYLLDAESGVGSFFTSSDFERSYRDAFFTYYPQ